MGRVHNVSVSFCNGDVSYQSYPTLRPALGLYFRRIIAALTGTDQSFPGQREFHVYLVTLIIKEPVEKNQEEARLIYHVNSGFFDCSQYHEEVRSA